jgi:hypothetical protein
MGSNGGGAGWTRLRSTRPDEFPSYWASVQFRNEKTRLDKTGEIAMNQRGVQFPGAAVRAESDLVVGCGRAPEVQEGEGEAEHKPKGSLYRRPRLQQIGSLGQMRGGWQGRYLDLYAGYYTPA